QVGRAQLNVQTRLVKRIRRYRSIDAILLCRESPGGHEHLHQSIGARRRMRARIEYRLLANQTRDLKWIETARARLLRDDVPVSKWIEDVPLIARQLFRFHLRVIGVAYFQSVERTHIVFLGAVDARRGEIDPGTEGRSLRCFG